IPPPRTKMASEETCSPKTVRSLWEEHCAEQADFRSKQDILVSELCSLMTPPTHTTNVTEEWMQKFQKLFKDWDETNQTFLHSVYDKYEQHSLECIDQLKKFQDHMIESELFDSPEEASKLLETQCIPIIGELQRGFENNLNFLDKSFSQSCITHQEALVQPIHHFCELLAEFWQAFGVKPFEAIHARLLQRIKMERKNGSERVQSKLAELESAIERVRKSPTVEQVDKRMEKVDQLFNQLNSIHGKNKRQQLAILDTYGPDVTGAISAYEEACMRFFGVEKVGDGQSESSTDEQTTDQNEHPKSATFLIRRARKCLHNGCILHSNKGSNSSTSRGNVNFESRGMNEEEWIPFRVLPMEDAVESVRHLHGNVTGFGQTVLEKVLSNPSYSGIPTGESQPELSSEPEEENEDVEDPQEVCEHVATPLIVDNLFEQRDLETHAIRFDEVVNHVKQSVRENFLTHLYSWELEKNNEVEQELVLRREEINAEYDLQISLVEEQCHRCRENIVNVRLTELHFHQERIDLHVEYVKQEIDKTRSTVINELNARLDELETNMQREIKGLMDTRLPRASRLSMLETLRDTVEGITQVHMNNVRQVLRDTRQNLETLTRTLNASNLNLIGKLRPFNDGGDFAVEEIKQYKTRLEDLAVELQAMEDSVAGAMEHFENDRQSFIDRWLKTFRTDMKHRMLDVSHAETVRRTISSAMVRLKSIGIQNQSEAKKIRNNLRQLESLVLQLNTLSELRSSHVRMLETSWKETNQIHSKQTQKEAVQQSALHLLWTTKEEEMLRETRRVVLHVFGELYIDVNSWRMFLRFQMAANTPIGHLSRESTMNQPESQVTSTDRPTSGTAVQSPKGIQKSKRLSSKAKLAGGDLKCYPKSPHKPLNNKEEDQAVPSQQGDEKLSGKVKRKKTKPPTANVEEKASTQLKDSSSGKDVATKLDTQVKPSKRKEKLDEYIRNAFGGYTSNDLEEHYPDPEPTMMESVKRICRQALQETTRLSDSYYREKGVRKPLTPYQIPANYREAARALVSTLTNYYNEMEAAHRKAVEELHSGLRQLLELSLKLPGILFVLLVDDFKANTYNDLEASDEAIIDQLHVQKRQRNTHIQKLRSVLGLPSMDEQLEKINSEETKRQTRLVQLVTNLKHERLNVLRTVRTQFPKVLSQLTNDMLQRCSSEPEVKTEVSTSPAATAEGATSQLEDHKLPSMSKSETTMGRFSVAKIDVDAVQVNIRTSQKWAEEELNHFLDRLTTDVEKEYNASMKMSESWSIEWMESVQALKAVHK
ncbi:Coiled-coil domain-containing protein 180, partial [Clonorchis sinensis]